MRSSSGGGGGGDGGDGAFTPFSRLRALEIAVTAAAAPALVTLLPNVTTLSLHAAEYLAPSMIFAVAALTQLQLLSLMFGSESQLFAEHILALRPLTRLRELSMAFAAADRVPDECFRQLLVKLPHLHTLGLSITTAYESQLLGISGEWCPQLRMLFLWGEFCLASQLEQRAFCPIFP
jgi:hypothetical protein